MNPTGRLINHRIAADGDLLDEFSTQPQGIGVQRRSKPKGTLYIENSAEMNYHIAFRLGVEQTAELWLGVVMCRDRHSPVKI